MNKAIWLHWTPAAGGWSLLIGLVLALQVGRPGVASGQASRPLVARAAVVRAEMSRQVLASIRSMVARQGASPTRRAEVGLATVTVTPRKPADPRAEGVASIQFLRN